jgi:hypothetical protein
MIRIFFSILRNAAWAPAAVLVFHQIAIRGGVRAQLDHVIHFSGGFAAAYFFYRSVKIAAPYLGELRRLTRYVLAFALTCTIALFWEFAEFASDRIRGTHIQQSVSETLLDLVFGVAGGILCLAIARIENTLRQRYIHILK